MSVGEPDLTLNNITITTEHTSWPYVTNEIYSTGTYYPYFDHIWIGDPLPEKWEPLPGCVPWDGPLVNENKLPNNVEEILEQLKIHMEGNKMTMNIYEVLVIDRKECTVLTKQDNIIAKDEKSAMLELDLSKEIKAKVKKDEIVFIFTKKGSFEKLEDKE